MANKNTFNRVIVKCHKYYQWLESYYDLKSKISTQEQARLGFYLFILENDTGINDYKVLSEMITDSSFNNQIFKTIYEDKGIDAIFIDEEKSKIKFYNFKYRNAFSETAVQSTRDAISKTSLYFTTFLEKNINTFQEKIYVKTNNIYELIRKTDEEWILELVIVSNENIDLKKLEDGSVISFQKRFGLEVKCIGLDEIENLFLNDKETINCKFKMNNKNVLINKEKSMPSYIIPIPLKQLIKVFCNDKEIREGNIVDSNIIKIKNKGFNYNVLYENVRGFILKSKINTGIIKTLKETPGDFFVYNNGLTIIADKVEAPNPSNKLAVYRYIFLKNLQVINGGQTIRAIYQFLKDSDEESIFTALNDAKILCKIIEIHRNEKVESVKAHKIAEYTNSQNKITDRDLKSVRTEQIEIEGYLREHNILYVRKAGDLGEDGKDYKIRCPMLTLGQILYSIQGSPESASNKRQKIFSEDYDYTFTKKMDLQKLPEYIMTWHEVKKLYNQFQKYDVTEQKVFYVLYIFFNSKSYKSKKKSVSPIERIKDEKIIEKFQIILEDEKNNNKNKSVSASRILIQVSFRKIVDDVFEIKNPKIKIKKATAI